MPCNSDYMRASNSERELSRVACLLMELDGREYKKSWWDGYHPEVYGAFCSKKDADQMVAELCSKLQSVEDVTKYSLEMQIWWRDHQAADKVRLEKEMSEVKKEADKQAALAKLSDYERKLLGLTIK